MIGGRGQREVRKKIRFWVINWFLKEWIMTRFVYNLKDCGGNRLGNWDVGRVGGNDVECARAYLWGGSPSSETKEGNRDERNRGSVCLS